MQSRHLQTQIFARASQTEAHHYAERKPQSYLTYENKPPSTSETSVCSDVSKSDFLILTHLSVGTNWRYIFPFKKKIGVNSNGFEAQRVGNQWKQICENKAADKFRQGTSLWVPETFIFLFLVHLYSKSTCSRLWLRAEKKTVWRTKKGKQKHHNGFITLPWIAWKCCLISL